MSSRSALSASEDPVNGGPIDQSTTRDGCTSAEEVLVGYVVSRRLESGPTEVLFLAPAAAPDAVSTVVKIIHTTPPPGGDAETLYRLHRRLVGATAPGSAPPAARPVGWGKDPDLFAYEYVPGVPVKERIESLAASSPTAEWPAELSVIARASGVLLAQFHLALPEDGTGPDAAAAAAGAAAPRVGRLHQLCRRVGVRTPAHLPPGRVRSLCDSGPHNMIVTPQGEVRLIDLPTDERWTFAEFDLGVLAHRLARRAAISFGWTASAGDARRVFVEPLCRGYEAAGGRPPDRSEVLASFAASSLVFAKRSLTIGHPLASVSFARRDVRWGAAALRDARAGAARSPSALAPVDGTVDGHATS